MIYLLIFLVCFYIIYPFLFTYFYKKEISVKASIFYRFVNRLYLDKLNKVNQGKIFGFTLFCGKQGGGKTYCAVEYAFNLCRSSGALLVSNTPLSVPADIDYLYIKDVSDIHYIIEDGHKAYCILLDEIQTLFESKNFDEYFYTIFCQLRKRNIKIIGTAQVFERVALKLREQVHELYYCRTFFGVLTRKRKFMPLINTSGKLKHKDNIRLKTEYIIQTDFIRNAYNTYYKV